MPYVKLMPKRQEDPLYRRHIKEALGQDLGEEYLERIAATQVKYGFKENSKGFRLVPVLKKGE